MAIGIYPKFTRNTTIDEVIYDPQVQAEFPILITVLHKLKTIPLKQIHLSTVWHRTKGEYYVKKLTGWTDKQFRDERIRFWELFDAHDQDNRDTLEEVKQYQARGIPLHPEVRAELEGTIPYFYICGRNTKGDQVTQPLRRRKREEATGN